VHNPLSDADSFALTRLLILVEDSVGRDPDCLLAWQVRDGLAACGLLADRAPTSAVGDALAQLQTRYRHSLGEFTERTTEGADCAEDG